MEKKMAERREQLEKKREDFKNQVGEDVKQMLMKNAEAVYKKNKIKIDNAEAEAKRQQIQMAKIEAAKKEGTYEAPGEREEEGWGKGSKIGEAKANR